MRLYIIQNYNLETQRRNSAFFLDEKKQSIFFLKMVDTNLMNKYQKKKNRSSGENEIFAHFSDFFVFKNGDFTYTGTFYSLIRSRMIFFRALLKHFFIFAT